MDNATINVMCACCGDMFPFPAKADARARDGYKLDFRNKEWWRFEDTFATHLATHDRRDLVPVLVELALDRVKAGKWAYDIV